jgi:hypothetical protein
MIGAYGAWAASLVQDGPASFSFRRDEWTDVEDWRPVARQRLLDHLACPDTGGIPKVTVRRQFIYDGLHVPAQQDPHPNLEGEHEHRLLW